MMNAEMLNNIFLIAPIVVFVVACVGIVWSVLKNRKYLIGFIFLLAGAGVYFLGLVIGEWEGMAVSLFFGGGIVLLGLLTLLFTFFYSKLRAAN